MTPEEIWEEMICDSLADMNIFSEQESAETAAEFLEETKKASAVAEAEQKRGPPERDISTVGTVSRETKWHPDLTRNQLERLRQWVKYDIKTSTNSIGRTANWTFRTFDGMPVFAIYSTENQSDPTILYEVKGAQAEYEREYLKDILEDFNHGESIDEKSIAIDEVLGRSWLRKAGSHSDDNGAVVRGSGSGNAGVLRKQSGCKPRAAFESVLRNLLQNKMDGVGGRTSQEPTKQNTHPVPNAVSNIQKQLRQELNRINQKQSGQEESFFEENVPLEGLAEIDAEAFLYGLDSAYEQSNPEYQRGQFDAAQKKNSIAEEVEKYGAIRYHEDGTVVVTDDWKAKGKVTIPKRYKPNAVIETVTKYKNGMSQVDRSFYDPEGWLIVQIHSGDHNKPHMHKFGKDGTEGYHKHIFVRTEDGVMRIPKGYGLNTEEKAANKDILRR